MEARLGNDFSMVRLHTGNDATRQAKALGAQAFTFGDHIAWASSAPSLGTVRGRMMLAHELVHVIQHRSDPSRAALRRFVTSERRDIATLDEVVSTAASIARRTGLAGIMRWGRFTAGAGGVGAIEALTSPQSGSTARLPNRYLFTCRCGLIDMRHFYQLMYIALQRSNRAATERGREHELTAEPESRFAPEDTVSNALGAFFGSQQSWLQRQSTFVSNLRAFLARCDAVDFRAMSGTDQDTVVNFYAARTASGAPATPVESATPAVLGVSVCGGRTRNAPFEVAPTSEDPHQKTIKRLR